MQWADAKHEQRIPRLGFSHWPRRLSTSLLLSLVWMLGMPALSAAEPAGPSRSTPIDTRSWQTGTEGSTQPANEDPSVRDAAVEALRSARKDWQNRYTAFGGPLALTLLGVGCLAGGIPLAVDAKIQKDKSCGEWGCIAEGTRDHIDMRRKAGLGLSIGGAAILAVGVALLSFRTSKSRQARELKRIDRLLHALGAQARFYPWLDQRSTAATFWSGGLAASFRF